MPDNKKIYLAMAGNTMESAGRTLQLLDADSKGADDKIGFAFAQAGKGITAYAFGQVADAKEGLRLAGEALIAASREL